MTASGELLSVRGLSKSYGPVQVLDSVDLDVRAGETVGLVGRNGAGKSTFVSAVVGRIPFEEGTITVGGEPQEFRNVADSAAAGIALVPQEIELPMAMSVREVVTLGVEPNRFGIIDRRKEANGVSEALAMVGLEVGLDTPVAEIPVSWQKLVMVAQGLYLRSRLIVLDEPTAGMDAADAQGVVEVVKTLGARGVGVLYISHRFDEVEAVCDRVVVLRDGRRVGELVAESLNQGALVEAMMDQEGQEDGLVEVPDEDLPEFSDKSTLAVSEVSGRRSRGITFEVGSGSITGLTGLPGSGVEEVFAAIAGTPVGIDGSVTVDGSAYRNTHGAIRHGVAYLPASRPDAVLGGEPVKENMILPALGAVARGGYLSRSAIDEATGPVIESLSLQPYASKLMGELSGGSQQRALVAGRLLSKPRFLVMADPTVGVDVAARMEIHELLGSLVRGGMGCLVGSSDPEELADLCDRVIVVRQGNVVADLTGSDVSEFRIVECMSSNTQTASP